MKRQNNLWHQVVDFRNLHQAAYAVLRGKRSNPEMGTIFMQLEGSLFEIQNQLINQSYQPGGYRTFWIHEPKSRLISAASIRDRVVHHALVQAIEPVFEKRFIHHSYACRKDKGTHRALRQFGTWVRSSPYVLKMDIRKFFPSIDHEILMEQIKRVIKDNRVLWLCQAIIESSNPQDSVQLYFPGDSLFSPTCKRRGLPIGNLTSQFFGNVYLDALDHFVKEDLKIKRYLRYVDDFCCFGESKKELQEIRQAIVEFLYSLRLKLNERKSRIRRVKEGIEFLGFVHTENKTRLNQTSIRRQRRRLQMQHKQFSKGAIGLGKIQESFNAWQAHTSHGDCFHLNSTIKQKLPNNLNLQQL